MTIKRLAGMAILMSVFVTGCTENYGRIRIQTDSDNIMTLEALRENWQDYSVYYTHRSGSTSSAAISAVMFDPKNDDKKLVGDSWIRIEDTDTLSEVIRIIQIWYGTARVVIIEGPDTQFFGFMYYSPWLQVPVKKIDERTLYVSSLPPYKSAP